MQNQFQSQIDDQIFDELLELAEKVKNKMSGMEWFPLLGLANRARKVVSGEDLVIKEIRNARAKLVLLTEDASSNTAKK